MNISILAQVNVSTQLPCIHIYSTCTVTEQQVTVYSHVDEQNEWIIEKADATNFTTPEFVENGHVVRLLHAKTHRRLHTHNIRPMTNDKKYQYEVR